MRDTNKLDIQKLSKRMGVKNAQGLLEILAKQKHFVDAVGTEVGQQLLKYHVERMQKLTELIVDEKDTPETRAELRAHRSIVDDYTKILSNYSRNLQEAVDKGT